jgi:anti-sigma factor RsiW
MSACDDKRLLLQALLDGELDAANAIAIEQHVKSCPGCQAELKAAEAVRAAVRAPGVAYVAPEAFRRRLRIALDIEARQARGAPGRSGGRRWSGWTVAGAGAVAACALVVVGVQQTRAPPLAGELVSDHVRSMLANHLTDVATSNRHVVKPWFDGKVAFAPTVVDFADKGFPLVGGRLEYVRGQRAAALVYRRDLHLINVFVWPVGSPADRLEIGGAHDGYNLVHWTQGGLNYWAVSDVEPARLRELRDLFLAAAKP